MNRVEEVRELMALLEENYIFKPYALRTAVECVYGMKEEFFRHNQLPEETKAGYDEKWEDAAAKSLKKEN
jgi:hypothetical protein